MRKWRVRMRFWCSSDMLEWNKARSSEIYIDKLHQAPPVYCMVMDSYIEVTWSITNNKRLKFSQYCYRGKRVFGEYPCHTHTHTHTHTKYSLHNRSYVLLATQTSQTPLFWHNGNLKKIAEVWAILERSVAVRKCLYSLATKGSS